MKTGRDRKPGDVQVVLNLHPSRVQEVAYWLERRTAPGSVGRDVADQIKAQGHGRRLVVIDPEDRKQVERFRNESLSALRDHIGNPAVDESAFTEGDLANAMQAALRSLVPPPKPEEPGRYGAILAGDGREWFRWTTSERQRRDWVRPGTDGATEYARWDDLTVVRVLRAGATL